MADRFDSIDRLSRAGGEREPQEPSAAEGFFDDVGGFLESTVSALGPELIGMEPISGAEEFRQENPIAGGTSQFIGTVVPFLLPELAPARAFSAIPGVGRAVRGSRALTAERPALGSAAEQTARLVPFEGARIGASALAGGDVGDVTSEAAFNLVAGAGISGGLGAIGIPPFGLPSRFDDLTEAEKETLERAGPRLDRSKERQLQEEIPDYNPDAPPQEKIQKILENEEALSTPSRSKVTDVLRPLQGQVRNQELPTQINEAGRVVRQRRAVKPLVGDKNNEGGRALSRRFNIQDGHAVKTRKLTVGGRGFADRKTLNEKIEQAGFTNGKVRDPELGRDVPIEGYMQLPRHITTKSKQASKNLQKGTLTKHMTMVDNKNKIWLSQEKDDGLYVMAKKVRGAANKFDEGDEYMIWKTNRPDLFSDKARSFSRTYERAFEIADIAKRDEVRRRLPIADLSDRTYKALGRTGDLSKESSQRGLTRRLARGVFGEEKVKRMEHNFKGSYDFFGRFAKRYVAPLAQQFAGRGGSVRAAKVALFARYIMDTADGIAARKIKGEAAVRPEDSVFSSIFAGRSRQGGLEQLVDDLERRGGKEAIDGVSRLTFLGMGPADARAAKEAGELDVPDESIDFIDNVLRPLDNKTVRDIQDTHKITGDGEFDPDPLHNQISRMWEGELRVPLTDENGHMVALGSGKTNTGAMNEAIAIQRAAREDGSELTIGDIHRADPGQSLTDVQALDQKQLNMTVRWTRQAREPLRFRTSRQVFGAKGTVAPLTKRELVDNIAKNIRDSERYMAARIMRNDTAEDMRKIRHEDREIAEELAQRLNDMEGIKGPLDTWIAEHVDPVTVKSAGFKASDVTRAMNQAVYHLTLGMGDIGFGALNAVTPLQTAVPEVAFALKATPRTLQEYYGPAFFADSAGRIREMRALDPLRIWAKGLKQMQKPDREFVAALNRASEENVTAPLLAEEVVGADASIGRSFREALSGERGYARFLEDLSSYIPSRTEEFSRTHAFSMGWLVGRDFFGRQGEDLYRFAREFTNRSMFRYKTSDRPRIITGAVGKMTGLFKNWMMHYTGNMATYAGEGIHRGNWAPMLWQQIGTFGVAGVGGISLATAANGFSEMVNDRSLMENTYNWFGFREEAEDLFGEEAVMASADFMYYGLPSLIGVSLQGRAGTPGSDVPQDISQMFSVAMWDRAVAGAETVGRAVETFEHTGQSPFKNQRVVDAFARFALPRTLQGAMQRTENGALRSLKTGNTLVSDTTIGDHVANALGFQSPEIARSYEAAGLMFDRRQEMREKVGTLGEQLVQARQAGDIDAISEIYKGAWKEGISPDLILRSADARQAKREEGLLQRQFEQSDPERFDRMRRILNLD